ncbi:mitochondrial fission factor-like [Latimeria chalumnae]|uniref:mitochondrial fission factor-like n=1 Tax=Latimeria chalumnae TaxID=7897 RepID=UPI0003C17CCB|nr:PREDICTED: mitochondrial fission factor homolog A-like [Latimeria chalumnae]|eukprot:XP_006001371.1 PREDICTED: mitochondrial fission factor homolog A-like [Latimeria chalumnae]
MEADLIRGQCDVQYTRAISRRMRVPVSLRVAEPDFNHESEKNEELPLSHSMHIPNRISLSDILDLGLGPTIPDQFITNPPSSSSSALSVSTVASADVHNINMESARGLLTYQQDPVCQSHRERCQQECENRAVPSKLVRQLSNRDKTSFSPLLLLPSFPEEQKNFSFRNVYRTAKLVGYELSQHVLESLKQKFGGRVIFLDDNTTKCPSSLGKTRPLSWPQVPSLHDGGMVSEGLENLSDAGIIALRRQLNKINHRLQLLEKECIVHKQNEQLLFSIMIAACLVNAWLWLRLRK